MNRPFAFLPVVDEVIIQNTGITFLVGGYLLNGTRDVRVQFVEGLSIHALDMSYFRSIGAKVTDRRQKLDLNEATEPEVDAAIAAEIYHDFNYPLKEE
jgi:hypothetical protein